MPAASILPVALHKGKLYFLFGKENPMEDTSTGFSDFGGGKEAGESFFDTAIREGSEELTGFFGSRAQLKARIRNSGGAFAMPYHFENGNEYRVHVIHADYDEALIEHYNNNHRFLWQHKAINNKTLNGSKLFEKIEIRWVCETQLRAFMPQMRAFYREIADLLIVNLPKIKAFIRKCRPNKSRRTAACSAAKSKRRPRIRGG
jgi:hypothetical protein